VTGQVSNDVTVISASTTPPAITGDLRVDDGPVGIAVDPGTDLIYVVNSGGEQCQLCGGDGGATVSIIAGSSNSVEEDLPAGSSAEGVAVDDGTGVIYTANTGADTVSMLVFAASITVGSDPDESPNGIAVDQASNTVFVANDGSDTVSVINGTTHKVTATPAVGCGPYAVTAAAGFVYVANECDSTVSVIQESNDAVTTLPSTDGFSCPYDVVADTAQAVVYVINECDSTVTPITESDDPANDVVGAAIPVGCGPESATQGTGYLYVVNECSDTVSVIAETGNAANTVTATIDVGDCPEYGMTIDTATQTGYVSANCSDNVTVIDLATNTVTKTLTGFDCPFGAAVDDASDTVYVGDQCEGDVSTINGKTDAVGSISLPGGDCPYVGGVNQASNVVFTSDGCADSMTQIDALSNTAVGTQYTGGCPYYVSVDDATNTGYVGGYYCSSEVWYATAKDASRATISASTTVTYGHEQTGVIDYRVSPNTPVAANGSVTIESDGNVLCTGTLSAGAGKCSPSSATVFPVGTYTNLVASYSGDGVYYGSVSLPGTLKVLKET
jgi:YVTN family beta-propeller protein